MGLVGLRAARKPQISITHEVSHVVKDTLMTRFPQIADAIIHIEPPPRAN